jgi:protoporphyrinogen oxidase
MIGVIGAGLTGLTLAKHLKKDVTILEKLPETGGLCRSVKEKGFTFDIGGSHIIFSKDKEVLDFMLKNLGNNKVKNMRNTKIFFKNRFVKYPFENGLSDLSIKDNFECIFYFVENLIRKKLGLLKEPTNFKECLYNVFGKGIAGKYLVPYNEKIWNVKTEDMNCEWVKDRLPQPSLKGLLKASLGIGSEGYVHQLFFYYPKLGGIQALTESISKKTKSKIILNYGVKSIKKIRGKFVVSDGKKKKTFSNLVSTIPLPDLIKIIKDPVPVEVKKAARNLKFNSIITVTLGLDTLKLNDISWLYIPDPKDGLFNRTSFPFNFSSKTTPDGKTSVLAEITCLYGDDVWKMKDKKIIEHVIDNLHKNKIIDKREISYSKVHHSKYAYVVYDTNHFNNKEIVKKFVENYGIQLCGRFSEVEYYNMDKCIRTAMDTANKLNKN